MADSRGFSLSIRSFDQPRRTDSIWQRAPNYFAGLVHDQAAGRVNPMKSLAYTNAVGLMLALLLLLARYLPVWAQRRYVPENPSEDWSSLTLKDPKLGQILPIQMAGAERIPR